MRALAVFVALLAAAGALFVSFRVLMTYKAQTDCKAIADHSLVHTEYTHDFIWHNRCIILMPDGTKKYVENDFLQPLTH